MAYTHYVLAKITNVGRTFYLNAAGSWHPHPCEATAFYDQKFVDLAKTYVSPKKGERLEVVKVTSSIDYVR